MKKKLKPMPRIKKEIFKGFSRIKWFLISNLIYFIRKNFLKRKKIKNKIAVLVPSKQRVVKLRRFIDSLIENTKDINRIYIEVLIDEDELQKNEYTNYITNLNKDYNINLRIKNEKTHNLRNNYLASKINCDLYFPLNDDVIFILKDWDDYIDNINSYIPKDKPFSIWTKASTKYPYLHSEFPIVNNSWYKRLGYIGNYHLFGYIDTWICELGKISKKFIIAKTKFIEHLNVEIKGSKDMKDKTYHDLMISQRDDLDLWHKTKNIRLEDSKKLL
tara:strand:+ start:3543 stop:4364 length:822 start_codon:yes stop_codon:yes gene_type:complete